MLTCELPEPYAGSHSPAVSLKIFYSVLAVYYMACPYDTVNSFRSGGFCPAVAGRGLCPGWLCSGGISPRFAGERVISKIIKRRDRSGYDCESRRCRVAAPLAETGARQSVYLPSLQSTKYLPALGGAVKTFSMLSAPEFNTRTAPHCKPYNTSQCWPILKLALSNRRAGQRQRKLTCVTADSIICPKSDVIIHLYSPWTLAIKKKTEREREREKT